MVVTVLLLACARPQPAKGERDPFTGMPGDPGDTGGTVPPTDLDGDGWSETDGDCDDANPAVYPGAYDRPNDGIDEDCVAGDRTCDCLVLDGGAVVAANVEGFDTTAFRSVDVAYLLDTSCATSGVPDSFRASFSDVVDALETNMTTLTVGLAAFDDYAYGSYGSPASGDKPFYLPAQQTDDLDLVQEAFDGLSIHGGSDGPESVVEGLYQALTGAGYDQDCDGTYDPSTDVEPFIANAADPFGGTGGQFYDDTDQSTGHVGGVGFREDSTVRVIVYATDNYLRDPLAGYGTPGGCPGDADSAEVTAAALESGVYLVGISLGGSLAVEQMAALADATDSVADLDGDGIDDPLVYPMAGATDEVGAAIIDGVEAVEAKAGVRDVYDSVELDVRGDPLGIVGNITPHAYKDVAWSAVDGLFFDVVYDTRAYGEKPVVGSVDFAVVGDGFDLGTVHVDVEIAPL